jgi:hypothetical protein
LTALKKSNVVFAVARDFEGVAIGQPWALAFHAKQGYEITGPFGEYKEHPLSVFMTKAVSFAQPSIGNGLL